MSDESKTATRDEWAGWDRMVAGDDADLGRATSATVTPSPAGVDTSELRRTSAERRKQFDDVAADALRAAADEIDRLRTVAHVPRRVDTIGQLDELSEGTVLRGLSKWGGVWQVTDDEETKRYSSGADSSYHASNIFLVHYGPFEVLWTPDA